MPMELGITYHFSNLTEKPVRLASSYFFILYFKNAQLYKFKAISLKGSNGFFFGSLNVCVSLNA